MKARMWMNSMANIVTLLDVDVSELVGANVAVDVVATTL